MTFQITDIPRLLPELMLLALALLVLGTDVLERWGTDAQSQLERGKAAGQLTVIGLGFVFIVALVQSKFLFTVPEPAPETNPVLFYLITLGRNLQAGGPGGEPILGAFATDNLTMIARMTFIGAAFLTTLLALDYRPSGNPGEFYALILFSTAGMNFMVLSVWGAVIGHSAIWHEPGVWLHRKHESGGRRAADHRHAVLGDRQGRHGGAGWRGAVDAGDDLRGGRDRLQGGGGAVP